MRPLRLSLVLILIASASLPSAARNAEIIAGEPAAKTQQKNNPGSDIAATDNQLNPNAPASPTPKRFWDQHATAVQGLTAILLAVFTGALVVTSLWQWRAIKEQAKTAEYTLIEQSRPWVSTEIMAVEDLFYDKESATLYVRVKLKNTGHSVATQVWPHFRLFVYGPTQTTTATAISEEIIRQQRSLAAEVKVNFQNRTFGYVLFPGAERELRMPVGASLADIQRASNANGICFALLECVDYRFTFGAPDVHHQTRYVFDLLRKGPSGPMLLFEPNERVAKEDLILGLSFMGESFAT